MATAEKGTKENPYTMEEYEALLDAGTWQGGFVRDDAGSVVYTMKEVTVNGYSGYSGYGSSGSGFGSLGSGWWGSDPMNGGNTDGDNTDEGGHHSAGNNTGGGGTNTSGGGGGHNGGSNNTNRTGTFNSSKPFYTRTNFNAMKANKTWIGGNVFSLGYVSSTGYIHPAIIQLGEVSESWINKIGNVANSVLDNIKKGCRTIITSPYVQAISRYYSATGEPLHLDVNTLGLNNMPNELLHQVPNSSNQYTINLLSTDLIPILSGHTLEECSMIISTALTLGNITLTKTGNNQYVIQNDTYDFEMHDWNNEPGRNILTILGAVVSEGICVNLDAAIGDAIGGTIGGAIGAYAGTAFMISAGLLNRHVNGTTSFEINIDGTLNTR